MQLSRAIAKGGSACSGHHTCDPVPFGVLLELAGVKMMGLVANIAPSGSMPSLRATLNRTPTPQLFPA